MGWNDGSEIAESVWDIVGKFIPKDAQSKAAASIISIFEGYDCDTMMETSLWEIANEPCPLFDSNNEESIISHDKGMCDRCDGTFWIKKAQNG